MNTSQWMRSDIIIIYLEERRSYNKMIFVYRKLQSTFNKARNFRKHLLDTLI